MDTAMSAGTHTDSSTSVSDPALDSLNLLIDENPQIGAVSDVPTTSADVVKGVHPDR